MSNKQPDLEMTFDINILEHLGLKMYSSLPAVIAEYVANAWDAGAKKVQITVPKTVPNANDGVIIQDDGWGMVVEEVNKKFLKVGRAKREEDGETVKVDGKERSIIGRKGIGKLAGFGIAGQVSVKTNRKGRFVTFTLDYDEMKDEAQKAEKENRKVSYHPKVDDWGKTEEKDGTTVILKRLKRVQPPGVDDIRKNLARRFSILDPNYDFKLEVNTVPIKPEDRDLLKKCQYTWPISDEIVDVNHSNWTVSGWIGTKPATISDEFERGVVVMCRGKLIQIPTLFDVGGTGFTGLMATAYLVGEIHAEFLDTDTDEVGTGRSSVIWEGEKGHALRKWGTQRLKQICSEWVDKRTETKLVVIKAQPLYKERIEKLPSTERKVVDSLLKKVAIKEDVTPEAIGDIASFLAEGIEYKGFLQLVQALDDSDPTNLHAVVQFLKEWEILDAVEMARIVEGRLHAIVKFQQLIDRNAKEIPDIHNFLVDNPWLLDPTWNYIDDEIRFSDLLKKKFREPSTALEEDRRIDFLCLGYGNTLHVIEIKRPSTHLGIKELRQLQDYVNFMKKNKGTGERSYDAVFGYIIGGSIQEDQVVHQMKEDWKKIGLYVHTFEELRSTAVKAIDDL